MALFEPFRAIGHIVDDVPFAVQRRGRETYATVSVGNAWQIYNTAKLTVVLIGPQLPRSITALACAGDVTLAALEGGDIVETRRVHVTGVYRGHTGSVVAMQVLGSTLLTLSTDGTLRAWTLGERAAPLQTLELGPGFTPSTLAHPDTYLNKVVVGSAEGRLQLWNFSTGTLLHEFRGLGSGIRVLAPSPALDARAFTWRLAHAVLGEHVLEPPGRRRRGGGASGQAHGEAAPRDAVTAVALSACGNFAVVGSADGAVHRYNMQSGLHRGEYQRQAGGGDAASEATAGRPSPAHDGAVAGLASDGANRWLVSGGEDGALRTWDFKRCGLTGELGVGAAVQRLACHPASGLVAVAPADLMLRIYDVEAQRLVRRFEGHLDRVTDLQFSEDCRWLLSSSMDGTLRVWDIPGSQLLQVLDMGGVVTSLSLSPAQDLLATTGQGSRGINLWAYQLIYGAGGDIVPGSRVRHAHLPALAVDPEGEEEGAAARAAARSAAMLALTPRRVGAPDASSDSELEISAGEGADALATLRDASSSEDEEEGGGAASTPALRLEDEVAGAAWAKRTPSGAPAPLAPAMLTLSLLPRSQWQSLAHLDVVKARNAPAEAPRKPEAAPFFLPSLAGARAGRDPVFVPGLGQDGGEEPSPGDGEEPALAAAAMAAWGGSEDEDAANGDEDVADGDEDAEADADADANAKPRRKHHPQSRVRGLGGASAPGRAPTLAALLAAPRPGSDEAVLGLLRTLTPVQVDGEDGGEGERLVDALLAFLEAQLCAGSCFDLVQALLRLTLDVHAGAILSSPSLQRRAAGLAAQLRASWQRVDDALNSTRCVLGLLGNLQP
ncbi:hypothetical protein APUTEX25_004505 [Auxenochlorella protothecoides]|uniref:WDR36/Utp21 C-terminal domain-containing protein n=1 Tax=Auxenochlorella protothecoides TaxID=3075 RepID=A0A3M7L037_AUXPR|nr:hypothetical protein APUTEX25_004505 [Auxenochlorella protothecoides]|eukprot:RMZ56081.1 hypothetical protein APUTEX25_004505 [Auxenochlorella protothecoides]